MAFDPATPKPVLTDGERRFMGYCPQEFFVPKRNVRLAMAKRMAIVKSLAARHLISGKVLEGRPDGYTYRVSLTNLGRHALGWEIFREDEP